MTAVNIDLRTPGSPAEGIMLWTPSKRRNVSGYVVLPAPLRVPLVGGQATVNVDTTGLDWVWEVREQVHHLRDVVRYVTVPETGPVAYGDLAVVDPNTLTPAPVPSNMIDSTMAALSEDPDSEFRQAQEKTFASHVDFAEVVTSEPIDSTTYIDAATVGPVVTVEVTDSGLLRLDIRARLQHDTEKLFMFAGFELSGANTLPASDESALGFQSATASQAAQIGGTFMLDGLNPGITTVTMKYRSSNLAGKVARRFLMASTIPAP